MIKEKHTNVYPQYLTLKRGNIYSTHTLFLVLENKTNKSIKWICEDKRIADIDNENKTIVAKDIGATKIIAYSTDKKITFGHILISVIESVPIEYIGISRRKFTLEAEKIIKLNPTIFPHNASNKSLIWISSNPKVSVVSNGVVKALHKGKSIITCIAKDGSGKKLMISLEVVDHILATSVEINPIIDRPFFANEDIAFRSIVTPSNAASDKVAWSSSNSKVVTINAVTGIAHTNKSGEAVISATAQDGSGAKGYYIFRVKNDNLSN